MPRTASVHTHKDGSSRPDRHTLRSNSNQSPRPDHQRRRMNRMGCKYHPLRHLFNISHFSHRWLRRLLRVVVNGQILVLRLPRIQFELPLPRICPHLMEGLEVLDKERLGDTRFEMCDVHDHDRGICRQEDQRVLVGSMRDPDLRSLYRNSVF